MFKIDFKKEYEKSDKTCPICNKLISLDEINKMDFVYSRTKIRKILFAHKKCYEERLKSNGDRM